ncbi:hypothetical protein HZP84_05645 [Elizabethkingia anophelis]|nr:hypothetical protein A2T74_05515 [Elizabethkingia anophelis]AMX49807.1 hypothetical protein A4C56_05515 [Elizabethkingia anophelis]AMX53196.1 hypothetical protein A2T72_05515 [Elizabethkingia anophelis]AMX56658.1 hypothetical protein A2T59_05515 [Elizabethkingia anophelis]EGT4345469.1 hypothetical protein [Elizabethkingia anophelis]
MQKDEQITNQTRTFIINWLRTGPDEKRKAFFDVWDIVLKNYLPTTRPILFRACGRISKKKKIASFTGKLGFVRRYSDSNDYLIICDTNEMLQFEERLNRQGNYKYTFYPLADVLRKARNSDGWGFSESTLDFIGEDEYIMRINPEYTINCKLAKNDF